MLTLARVRHNITITRVLALSCVFLAACTSQEVLRPYQYKSAHSEKIYITAKSGQQYDLEAPWTSDNFGNISGKGKVLVDSTWRSFEGEIPFTEIDKVTVSTFSTPAPALIYGIALLGVVAIVVSIVALTGGLQALK